jgi:hypothetical protein
MGGECSQKLRPRRGLRFLSGAQQISAQLKINTLPQRLGVRPEGFTLFSAPGGVALTATVAAK